MCPWQEHGHQELILVLVHSIHAISALHRSVLSLSLFVSSFPPPTFQPVSFISGCSLKPATENHILLGSSFFWFVCFIMDAVFPFLPNEPHYQAECAFLKM